MIENYILDYSGLKIFMATMSIIGVFVFIALYFINAGYGKFASRSWGPAIPNKIAWILMECPVFFVLCILWYFSERRFKLIYLAFFIIFQIHYFQRSFIFPFLLKGKSYMPILIMLMGATFNVCNGYIQGCWLFYASPEGYYTNEWFCTPQFIIGTIIFFTGMFINIHSDHVIRNLRKPGDTKHYLPNKGMYRFVTSANYLGEIIEWFGYFILTLSPAALVFVWFTFANLVPRAHKIYDRYLKEFGKPVLEKKRVFPFIY
ncbi:3-oxo-5-alpha-steroid 4-dehydrogenase family protein [Trichomonas vaginalis G3]|uniref:3-oxo-5-alpha-steroid 4-dehydrogenase 1 n=1 Tax=Trichomonas vaginalis (strain ATCC PRA-98 / G3) TaxID=412133 RepID=A2DFR5_TRIV3|nr:3-oxo-5-alpha-steroid 4-dehydrogenase protein [Trichomonas vaginalis G3]EAY20768.1 3-oxo-5-alpha-steroid 4-dehydrogenase family protein [Trichomonas vaginalis G3]KAI5529447.1 3-oxo-5-alpha-steroid 4-dehydrogenase protein [Trichomonas vaginalis G3]|eukprot:XP_001581754.1 3-oxo-5-alpha-steroid 4-dehydrogenase family protein [Trichomonas vaginalis G3]